MTPLRISTTPGRLSEPDSPKTFVPGAFAVPRLANHEPPRDTIAGIAASVSTLLITVGLPQRPDSTGNGGRVRGMARRPSIDSSSAVSSPSTKPPAPRRNSTPQATSRPSIRSPTIPAARAWATARPRRSADSSASPWTYRIARVAPAA